MRAQKTLARAERLYRQRRFGDAVSLLEAQVFHHRDNPRFYELLGTACLRMGEFGGAHTYLTRARQLRPGASRVDLALALVLLFRRDVSQAITIILEAIEHDPRNRRAKRLLAMIRTTDDYSEFAKLSDPRSVRRLLPSVGLYVPGWAVVALASVALIVAGIAFLPPVVTNLLRNRVEVRDGVEPLLLELPADVTDPTGTPRYEFSPTEVEALFSGIGELFNEFRDNLARREANRLLLSNANQLIKERVLLVASYFRVPTFADFQDNFSFREVAEEPWLHDGCHVRWNGRTSNMSVSDDGTRFVLLVGYTDEQTLDGTVAVHVPFDARVDSDLVELIGRVEYEDGDWSLVATGIRPIIARSAE